MFGLSDEQVVDLQDALRAWHEEIILEWRGRVRQNPRLAALSSETLLDHIPVLLGWLSAELDHVVAGREPPHTAASAEQHGLTRLTEAVDLSDSLDELSELRHVLLERWLHERAGIYPPAELHVLNRAIDAVLSDSATAYANSRQRLVEALDGMAMSAMDVLPPERALERMLAAMAEGVEDIDTAAVFLLEGDRLVLRAVLGRRQEELGHFSLAIGEGFAGRIAATVKPAFTDTPSFDPEVKSPALRELNIQALYGAPLISRGALVGVATIGSVTASEFSSATRRLMRALTTRAAEVIAFQQTVVARDELMRDLERERNRLGKIIGTAPVGIAVIDGDEYRVKIANPAFSLLAIEPFRSQGVEGRFIGDIAPEESRRSILDALRGAATSGAQSERLELSYTDPQHGETHWNAWVVPLSSRAEPELLFALSDVSDQVTQRRRMEDLVRMLSHDLRTPLGTIALQSQLLGSAVDNREGVARRAEAIGRSAASINSMVQALVDVTRLEMGASVAAAKPVGLQEFLVELLDRLRGTLDVERVHLALPDGLPPAVADPVHLERMVVNLVGNALKYSPPGSDVTVSARSANGHVAITVEDRGRGISAAELPHVFERFFRGHAVGQHVEGLGLGLYITHLLAEANGGTVRAESEEGKGSRFTVHLPAARHLAPAARP